MKYYRRKRVRIYIVCVFVACLVCACGAQQSSKITYTGTAMGTIIQQTLYVNDLHAEEEGNSGQMVSGEEISHAVMDLLVSLERNTLSWRIEESEIGQINGWADSQTDGMTSDTEQQAGYSLSGNLLDYLKVIEDVWEKSDGALDVTIGQVTRLWDLDGYAENAYAEKGEAGVFFEVPAQEVINEALKNTGFEKVRIEGGKIFLPEGMQLDLGAVGKGIACDEVKMFLEKQDNVKGAVISVGGSVLTYGEKADGTEWNIGIQHPREQGESIATLKLPGSLVVSTSGDYERYVETNGVRYHHILDPKTGKSADSGVISVTIVSESGILSDALSTACFVLGKDAGLNLAQAFDAEAFIVDSDMQISMTEGMDKYLVLQ